MNRGKAAAIESSGLTREFMKWTEDMDARLLHSMIEESRIDNRVDGSWTSQAYSNIVNHLHSSGLSGFAWNPVSITFHAEDEVWMDLIQSRPTAAKWRVNSMKHYDLMVELWVVDRVTGTPSEFSKIALEPLLTSFDQRKDAPNECPPRVNLLLHPKLGFQQIGEKGFPLRAATKERTHCSLRETMEASVSGFPECRFEDERSLDGSGVMVMSVVRDGEVGVRDLGIAFDGGERWRFANGGGARLRQWMPLVLCVYFAGSGRRWLMVATGGTVPVRRRWRCALKVAVVTEDLRFHGDEHESWWRGARMMERSGDAVSRRGWLNLRRGGGTAVMWVEDDAHVLGLRWRVLIGSLVSVRINDVATSQWSDLCVEDLDTWQNLVKSDLGGVGIGNLGRCNRKGLVFGLGLWPVSEIGVCVLRTLGYQTCIKLIACRDDERVCYGRENASDEFFYCYAALFYDLYVRLPFTTFQMDVLRTLNVAPSQLHPNSWGYVQAFGVLCRALGIRPTVGLFLYFFRCRPVATKGWVSLISEPGNALLELYLQSYRNFKEKVFKVSITDVGLRYFFDGEGNPRFPLYWTQDPLRFTSWPEDKMTIEELEALSVLTSLPRPISSRQLIDCLEFDDADARVFEIMGRKGSSKSWFQTIGNERAEVNRPGSSAGHVVGQPRPQVPSTGPVPVILSASTDETTAAEVPLVRKRKTKAVDTTREASKKRKEVVDETERPLPQGVWDPAFTLGHKVDLNMDASEKKVFENMSEQEIADTMLEMTTRAQALAWHLAYASDRGIVRVELEKVRTQLKELTEVHTAWDAKQKRAEQLPKEAETLLNDTREAGLTLRKERDQMASELEQAKRAMVVLAKERNELKAEASERNELGEELKEAIMIEHTRGFRKALRQVGHLLQVSTEGVEFDVQKDVYEGQLKPLNEIPEDAILEGEEDEEVVANTEHNGAVDGGESAAETVG
ncbi:hypothetical protein LR48_Vigan06g095600 [Vigna angularis]|uniref:Transposase (putative) gypsy type domain-containing protein n=1 Tax=Phaseolus angularis TaxID=3914 RepID=A0A0L9US01_PHAAN|nr:hypothetical protein LR48_Vigan06g095600 [Vigna angularis]